MHAWKGIINPNQEQRHAWIAFLERMKTVLVQQNVKSAALGNIKIHLATTPVWIAKSANT